MEEKRINPMVWCHMRTMSRSLLSDPTRAALRYASSEMWWCMCQPPPPPRFPLPPIYKMALVVAALR